MNGISSFHPKKSNAQLHIGFIPDGGGRFHKKWGYTLEDGYRKASTYILDFIKICFKEKANIVSIYGASSQNFKRNQEVINAFCKAYNDLFKNELIKYSQENNIQLIIIGNRNLLPQYLIKTIHNISINKTKSARKKIYFLIGYDPIQEIISSIENSTKPKVFMKNLWVKEPLDIVIRTGGANVLSNFLPLQSAYARIYFLDKIFPEIKTEEYINIIRSYRNLLRKYGE